MKSKLKRFLIWLNIAVILATLCAHMSPSINPEKTIFFAFLGLGYLWLFLANIGFIVFWTMTRPKWAWLSIAMLFMGWFEGCSTLGLHFDGSADEEEKTITITTFNVQNSNLVAHPNAPKQTHQSYKKRLSEINKPDIFCGQETRWKSKEIIQEVFEFTYAHAEVNKGTAIFSEYPIVDRGYVDFGTKTNSCIWADLKINEDTIRLYNVHLQSNRISKDAEKISGEGDLSETETYRGLQSILGKYKQFAVRRAQQATRVREHMSESPYPIILCGDLNDTPKSFAYAKMAEGLDDTFMERGRGIGTTYAGVIPALRIDYIFVDKDIDIIQHRINETPISDHFAVEAMLEL